MPPSAPSCALSQVAVQTLDRHGDQANTRGGPLAEFSFLGFGDDEKESGNPFSVYGVLFKKYLIEVLDGEKIISRKKGFTVDTCVSGLSSAEEQRLGPRFAGLPLGEKVTNNQGPAGSLVIQSIHAPFLMQARVAGSQTCRRSKGPDLATACKTSCEEACAAGVAEYASKAVRETGIRVEESELARGERPPHGTSTYSLTVAPPHSDQGLHTVLPRRVREDGEVRGLC